MAWDDFWEGANKNLAAGANIGADAALRAIAAKIQARQEDKKNLYDEVTAANKRELDKTEWDRQQGAINKNKADEATAKLQLANDAKDAALKEEFEAFTDYANRKGYSDIVAGLKPNKASLKFAQEEVKTRVAEEKADRDYKRKLDDEKRKADEKTTAEEKEKGEFTPEQARLTGKEAYEATGIPAYEKKLESLRNLMMKADPAAKDNLENLKIEYEIVNKKLKAAQKRNPSGQIGIQDSLMVNPNEFFANRRTPPLSPPTPQVMGMRGALEQGGIAPAIPPPLDENDGGEEASSEDKTEVITAELATILETGEFTIDDVAEMIELARVDPKYANLIVDWDAVKGALTPAE